MKQQEKTVNVVEKAKVYIAEHFSGEISLEETAKELGISSYYLSKLFKESENVNYIDYCETICGSNSEKSQLMETEKSNQRDLYGIRVRRSQFISVLF